MAILCSILMVVGIVGVFVPIIPGIPLAWLGLFIYAIGTGFERISLVTIIVLFILMALIMLLDFLAPMLGAKKYRASKLGIMGAFIGLIAGIVFFLGDYRWSVYRGFCHGIAGKAATKNCSQVGIRYAGRFCCRYLVESNLYLDYGRTVYRLMVLVSRAYLNHFRPNPLIFAISTRIDGLAPSLGPIPEVYISGLRRHKQPL